MRLTLYTNSISAHQLPLAREIVARIGAENFRYVYTGELQGGAQEVKCGELWIWEKRVKKKVERRGGGGERDEELEGGVRVDSSREREKELGVKSQEWLENCEVLLSGIRDVELMERRARKGLTTCYMSERWFKPIEIKVERRGGGGQWCFHLPGRLRLLVPGYRKMARRIVRLIAESPRFYYLAAGPWAAKDMRSIARSFRVSIPEDKIIQWGYFVAPATEESSKVRKFESLNVPDSRTFEHSNLQTFKPSNSLRVLWVGRMLDWKRVDTIVRAVAAASKEVEKVGGGGERMRFYLTLVGDGPERERLLKLAEKLDAKNKKETETPLSTSTSFLHLLSPVPIGQVRNLMREHDIYVLASNAQEGWGAAVNEALEEGMIVIGTDEAGASAALLPRENLYHAGDWKALARLLQAPEKLKRVVLPREFTPAGAAERLMQLVSSVGLLHSSVI